MIEVSFCQRWFWIYIYPGFMSAQNSLPQYVIVKSCYEKLIRCHIVVRNELNKFTLTLMWPHYHINSKIVNPLFSHHFFSFLLHPVEVFMIIIINHFSVFVGFFFCTVAHKELERRKEHLHKNPYEDFQQQWVNFKSDVCDGLSQSLLKLGTDTHHLFTSTNWGGIFTLFASSIVKRNIWI